VIELTPLPLLLTANAAAGKRWANLAAEILGGVTGGLVFLIGVADLAGAPVLAQAPNANLKLALDISVMATGLLAAVVSARTVRTLLASVLPIDPDSPVHAVALALTVVLFGLDAAVISFTDVLGSVSDQPALSIADLVGGQLPFLVLALAGVGLFTRRSLAASLSRLGIVAPRWWHIALALAAAGVFFAFSQGMDALSHALTPGVAGRVDSTTQHVFGQLTGPLGIAAVALLPGICEETLFRGALQPRLGLLVTALVFTSVHTEYGLSIDTLAVFTLALGLGLVRKYTSTTGSATCHVAYNLLAGIGVMSGPALGVGLAVEAALVAASAYGIWRHRRS
jgi:membrane protease YdiL (CAAX protease family)